MTDAIQQEPSSSSSPAPSTSSTLVSGSPPPNWRSIRPWTPPLTLSVREVTSVSVTFVLSATTSQTTSMDLDPDLENDLDNDEQTQQELSIISEALAKGLSVNVNGSPWQRVFIRIDDPADEAVIIIYGLMPGRQYDIDLGVVHARQLRQQVTTEDAVTEPPSPTIASIPAISVVANTATANTTSTTPQNTTDPTTTSPAPPPFTIEDRLAQLNHTLSLLTAERESLQTQIKSVRRDGQKADAALRSEIEALKRASEKYAAAEARGKQKILALQEAVKRAQAGVKTTEEQLSEIKSSLPNVLKEKEYKEAEYQRVKKEAEKARKEREAAEDKDRKRLEKLRTELTALTHKAEKLGGKREKLEGNVIPDLEEQLKQTRQEMESIEKEEEELAVAELANTSGLGVGGQDYSVQGYLRRRPDTDGASSSPGPISRPQKTPEGPASSYWNNIASPRLQTSSSTGQTEHVQQRLNPQPRRDSYPYPPGLLELQHSGAPPSPSSSSSSSPIGPYPPGLQRNPVALSSRAPSFEPSRNTMYVAPIQRPNGAKVQRSSSGSQTQTRHA